MDVSLQNRILHYKSEYPGWGAKMIVNELIQQDNYGQSTLPSLRTINRFLESHQKTVSYETHHPLTNPNIPEAKSAHDFWQMDDKGPELYEGLGYIGMINIKDVKSRVYVCSTAINLPHTRSHPDTTDYQYALRMAFNEFGLPKAIQSDRGSNFYENKSKSPFPTTLHLWLLGLGVDLSWANSYRPTEQGIVERSHEITHQQNWRSSGYKNIQHFQEHVNDRRKQLNRHISCDTLGKPPLVAYPQAIHSARFYNPLEERKLFDPTRIDAYLAQQKWYRKVSSAKTVSIGGQVYYLSKAKKKPNSLLLMIAQSNI